jgi:hypothetical protein
MPMSETQWIDERVRERLLVMAASLHGARPRGPIHANCGRVLGQALLWAGLWNDQLNHHQFHDLEDPIIEEWYGALIRLTRHVPGSEALIEGFGNLGSDTRPPAFPAFTACRLTAKGRELAERLFARCP